MILDLVENVSLLTLGVLGYCHVRGRFTDRSSLLSCLVQGLMFGVIALLSMSDPMRISPGIQIDSRNSIIALAALFGGAIPGTIAALMAAAYRLWLGGPGAVPGTIGIVLSCLIAIAVRSRLEASKTPVGYRHLVILGLVMAALVLGAISITHLPESLNLVSRSEVAIPVMLIVPPSLLLFGAIIMRLDQARSLERVVTESETRFRTIIDNLPVTLSIRDRDNRLLLVNSEYANRYGKAASDLIGQSAEPVWDRLGITSVLKQNSQQVWDTGEVVQTPPLAINREGHPGWVVCTTFPMRSAGGGIQSIGTITTDVTEVMVVREALRRREQTILRHQHALTEILRVGSTTNRTFLEEARPILEIAAEAMGVDRVGLYEMDFEADRAQCIDDWNRAEARHETFPDARISAFPKLLEDLERRRVIASDDWSTDPRLAARRDVLQAYDLRSGIIAAIYLGAKMQAFVTFRMIGVSRQWTPEEMAFVQAIAGAISLLLLTRQHRESLAALNLVTNGIFAERDDGRVIYANKPALELAGLPSRDTSVARVIGMSSESFPHPGVRLEGSRDSHEIEWTIKGTTKNLEIHRSRLPDGGTISVIVDVTNRRAGQREREQLQTQLQQASRMEAIGQLAGGVAHDFNNLLGAISGFAGFLDQDIPRDTEQHHFVARILSACERGKALVDQILTFSRVRAIERIPIDLHKVIQHGREVLTGSMPLTVRLSFDLGHGAIPIFGNEEQIGQVVTNLCINARDALPNQTGDIAVSLTTVFPGAPDYHRSFLIGSLSQDKRYARLDVRDSGVGIAPEHLARIFEPFFTTKERGRGTGLGLAIVHGIVVSHEGACAVESERGKGSRFSVYLPISDRLEIARPIARKQVDVHGRERILLVDDEIDITDMLSIGLERLGYEVAAVNDPQEALAVFSEDPQAWDAVITDHLMPGMSGLDLAEKLKDIRADVIIVICTGLNDGVVGPTAQKLGIEGFFPKPVSPETIAAHIRGLRPHDRGGQRS